MMADIAFTANLAGEAFSEPEAGYLRTFASTLDGAATVDPIGAGYLLTAAIAGTSTWLAAATVQPITAIASSLVAGSEIRIDPTKVSLPNFIRGPQATATAKPPAIPTIRVVPQAPRAPQYLISLVNRRREER